MTAIDPDRKSLEPLLSVKEVARFLGISESSVYRRCRAGDLPSVKVGGRTLFEQEAVRQFIEASRRISTGTSTAETQEAA
jgi:excisionase family DNA binding protein